MVLYKDRMDFFPCPILFLIRPRILMALPSLHQQTELMTSIDCCHLHWDPRLGTQCLWGHFYMLNMLFPPKVIILLLPTLFHSATVSPHSQGLLRRCSLFLLAFYTPKELSVIYKCVHYTMSISSSRSLLSIRNKISPRTDRERALLFCVLSKLVSY